MVAAYVHADVLLCDNRLFDPRALFYLRYENSWDVRRYTRLPLISTHIQPDKNHLTIPRFDAAARHGYMLYDDCRGHRTLAFASFATVLYADV